jgi:hypothetical protein
MTIIQIFSMKNEHNEGLRRKVFFLSVIIFFIFCAAVSWAQNVVIQVYDPQIVMLKPGSLLPMNFFSLRNDLRLAISEESEANFWKIDKEEIFKQYLKIGGSILVNTRQASIEKRPDSPSSREVFNAFYNTPGVEEKAILRQEWEKALGFDVWNPYYKYKEIEKKVKSKLSVRVFRLKGEPRVERDKFFYVFATAF